MKGADWEVIPSLMDVLREAMEDANREPRHIRYHYAATERQIARYLGRESFPPGERMEALVGAVACETNSTRLGLWRKALDRAASATALGADDREVDPTEVARGVEGAEERGRGGRRGSSVSG